MLAPTLLVVAILAKLVAPFSVVGGNLVRRTLISHQVGNNDDSVGINESHEILHGDDASQTTGRMSLRDRLKERIRSVSSSLEEPSDGATSGGIHEITTEAQYS